MTDKEFPQGISFKKPHEKAPDFVKGCISIKVSEFIDYLNKNERNGWINLDLKKSKGGKLYLDLNDYKKDESNDSDDSEVPF